MKPLGTNVLPNAQKGLFIVRLLSNKCMHKFGDRVSKAISFGKIKQKMFITLMKNEVE